MAGILANLPGLPTPNTPAGPLYLGCEAPAARQDRPWNCPANCRGVAEAPRLDRNRAGGPEPLERPEQDPPAPAAILRRMARDPRPARGRSLCGFDGGKRRRPAP